MLGSGFQPAHSQDSTEASADGSSSGAAGGSDSSSADQSASGGVDNSSDGSGASASGESSASAEASQTSGSDSSSAGAETGATAEAEKAGDVTSATGEATAAGIGTTSSGPTAGTTLTASANAEYGPTPSAQASTTKNAVTTTSAVSVFGVSANAYAPGGSEFEKVGNRKTVAIAIAPDGSYSIAVTTKKSSYAKSGIYDGDYQSFSANDVKAAVRAAASAYAKATPNFAEAGAQSRALGKAFNGGFAVAESNSRAHACVGNCSRESAFGQQRQLAQVVRVDCDWEVRRKRLLCLQRE